MKLSTIVGILVLSMMAGGATLAQPKQDPAQPAAPAQPAGGMQTPSPEEMQKMMAEMTAPAEEHKRLWKLEGPWNLALTWSEGGKEMKETSTSRFSKVFNGLFMQQEVNGKMMGVPFHGLELMGYSKATKKYQTVWIDSMGTGMMISEGTADSTGKVITFTGTMDDPMVGGRCDVRTVVTHIDDNKFTFDMYGTMGDKEEKMMSIVYTRATESKPAGEGMHKMAPAKPATPDKK